MEGRLRADLCCLSKKPKNILGRVASAPEMRHAYRNISETIVPSQIKHGMIITTIELYADILLFVTFDLYLGHRVSICEK